MLNPPGLDAVVTVQILSDLCSFLLSSCFSSILVAIGGSDYGYSCIRTWPEFATNPVRSTLSFQIFASLPLCYHEYSQLFSPYSVAVKQ